MSLVPMLHALLTLGKGVTKGLPGLTETDDPIAFFQRWFDDARQAGLFLPESMALATATRDGRPSGRMVLLKGVDQRGFEFYTNHDSRKGAELAENPRAALTFHWGLLERQVRVEGTVAKLSREESEAYFRTRPRGSQLGAWASKQSAVLESRQVLESEFREVERTYAGRDVPLPEYWGGWRVRPERIEFWQGRLDRLHDRVCYTRDETCWRVTRLYP